MINFILAVLFSINLQCYEGKPLFEYDRARMLRSGIVGFTLHGSLSHYYYQFCEVIIIMRFAFAIGWLVGPPYYLIFLLFTDALSSLLSRHFSLSKIGGLFQLK